MNSNRLKLMPVLSLALMIAGVSGCVPMETVSPPTLNDVRLGNARGHMIEDTRLRAGEVRGEVAQIDPARQQIYIIADNGRRESLPYELERTTVVYHGRPYSVEHLQAGDRIAYQPAARSARYVDTIRILEPVQARSASSVAQDAPPRSRARVVEGTVEAVDHNLGIFEVRPRTGRTITVSVPYNARAVDIDNFRDLRRGDHVRVEGEFINQENFQLLSFVSPRDR